MRTAVLGGLALALLVACAPMNQPAGSGPSPTTPIGTASPLAGPTWVAMEIATRPVLTEATLKVAADGTVSGTSGCNNYAGTAMIAGDAIGFDALVTTKMACPDAQMEQEYRYYQALTAARYYRLDSNTLRLQDDSGATLVLYRR